MDKVRGNINRFSFATSPCPGLRELRYKEVKVYIRQSVLMITSKMLE